MFARYSNNYQVTAIPASAAGADLSWQQDSRRPPGSGSTSSGKFPAGRQLASGRAVGNSDEGSSNYDGLSALEMAAWLGGVEVHVMVDVILVGFRDNGVGDEGSVALDEAILQQHLGELVRGVSTDGKGGVPITVVDQARGNELVRLGIRQETLFEVSHARPGLSRQVKEAVESAIHTEISKGGKTEDPASNRHAAGTALGIPRTAVDDAIRLHHSGEAVSYSLYLLHPNVRGRYEYIHERPAGVDLEDGTDEALGNDRGGQEHKLPGGCAYVGWVGKHERYAWLDLGAYITSGWGPRKRALGVVSPSTLPDLTAAAEKEGSGSWLYPELAALAHRTASQLIVPPLLFTVAGLMGEDFRPLSSPSLRTRWWDYGAETGELGDGRKPEEVVVRLFLVCDVSPCPAGKVRPWAGLGELLREPASGGRRQGVNRLMPRVTVETEEIVLWEHPLLAAGLQQAVHSTSGGPFATPGSMSLAATELRYWFRRFLDGRAIGRHGGERDEEGQESEGGIDEIEVRSVPLFVINLDVDTPLLLDHSARSTVFPDMIVSVDSRDGAVVDSMFQCGGRNVMLAAGVTDTGTEEGKDGNSGAATGGGGERGNIDGGLLRDTVASLAQVIWGAPPRSLSWDPLTDTLGTDFLWATGASVHTPLSSHSSLTFTERDAYLRTQILLKVDGAVGAARDVLEQVAWANPRLVHALYGKDYGLVEKHWRGVEDSLTRCLDELAVHHHETAVRFARVLETHVAGLGAALSRGYGDDMYHKSCQCHPASGSSGDPMWGSVRDDEGGWDYFLVFERGCYSSAVLCLVLAVWRIFARRGSGRSSARGWRKHKFS